MRPLLQIVAAIGLVVSFVFLPVGMTVDLLDHEQLRYEFSVHHLQEIRAGLDKYRADVGRYPSAAEGLAALRADPGVNGWAGPYLGRDQLLADLWGRAFIYRAEKNPPEVISYGADGKPGGTGLDADLSTYDGPREIPHSQRYLEAIRIQRILLVAAFVVFIASAYVLIYFAWHSDRGRPKSA